MEAATLLTDLSMAILGFYQSPSTVADAANRTTTVARVLPIEADFSFDQLRPFPLPWRAPFQSIAWVVELVFGVMSLFALLAFLSAIPIVNFLALGYLLEAEGRVARTGKLRYAMPLLPLAPRLGTIVAGIGIWLIPVMLIADAASDAELVAPGSSSAIFWRVLRAGVMIVVSAHLLCALARGGGFFCFFRPIKNVRWLWQQLRPARVSAENSDAPPPVPYLDRAEATVRAFVSSLRIGHHFWLGLRGFFGAFLWLFIPTVMFGAFQDTNKPGQVVVMLLGGALLIPLLSWLPYLQARFAAEEKWSALFQLKAIRELYRRAPLVLTLGVVLLYALSLPLYLFKAFAMPRDVMWFLTPIFIITVYPARIFAGWAYAQAYFRGKRSWLMTRWTCGLLLLPLLAFYVFLLFFTPTVGAYGKRVLFEHHAILLPIPALL